MISIYFILKIIISDYMHKLAKKVKELKGQQESKEWLKEMNNTIYQLDQTEKNYYYLLMADVNALNLRDLKQARKLLQKVRSQREVVNAQVLMRKCYFGYLEGNYQQAGQTIDQLIESFKSSQHLASIFSSYFRKMVREPQLKQTFQSDRQEYECQYLKALQLQRQSRVVEAINKHKSIVKKWGKLGQSVKYQSAKHIDMLSKQISKRSEGIQQYRKIIKQQEQELQNKDYYKQKVAFLMRIFDLIDEADRTLAFFDCSSVNQQVIKRIDLALETQSDPQIQVQLKQLKKKIKNPQPSELYICYQFLGDKAFKQSIKKSNKKQSQINIKDKSMRNSSRDKLPRTSLKDKQLEKSKTKNSPEKAMKLTSGLKHTFSRMNEDGDYDPQFRGSVMTKINYNSSGYEDRYFYIDDDFKNNMKLYYCAKQSKKSQSDDYYRLKGFKKMQMGKMSKALKREECQKFDGERCFTLKVSGEEDYQRNFFVQDQEIYEKWVGLFGSLGKKKSSQQSAAIQSTKIVL